MTHRLICLVALVLASGGLVLAQETTTGSLAGIVVDVTGAVLPGATVTVTSAQGDRTFVTDGDGRFFAPFLTPGRYGVKVELMGFSSIEQKDIDVHLGQRYELQTLTLKVGEFRRRSRSWARPP